MQADSWFLAAMAASFTLYRFQIDLSDVDRGVYENLNFRIALHPSETPVFLVARVLAYALNFQTGLEFSPQGLSDPDAPALRQLGDTGNILMWIEIGNPSTKKLHKAAKTARTVKVYTYKDPKNMMNEVNGQGIHRVNEIEFYSFAPAFLERIANHLERDNRWTLVHVDGAITINIVNQAEQGEVARHLPTA